MKALDTNVLVRFLVRDDPQQSARAKAFVERAIAAGEPLFLPDVVLAETVWVLESAYGFGRPDVVATLRQLLRSRDLRFSDADGVSRAIEAFERGRGGFADYLIREEALAPGCSALVTFDKKLQKEPGFEAP